MYYTLYNIRPSSVHGSIATAAAGGAPVDGHLWMGVTAAARRPEKAARARAILSLENRVPTTATGLEIERSSDPITNKRIFLFFSFTPLVDDNNN